MIETCRLKNLVIFIQAILNFVLSRKIILKLTQIELTKAILACQNDDMLSETGLLCLKIQEAFEKEAL